MWFAILITSLFYSSLALAEAPVPIRTQSLEALASYPTRSAPATSVSLNDSQISSEIAARVEEIAVRVGDFLEPGSRLISLDCASFKHRLASRRSQLAVLDARRKLAERRLARTKKLAEKQSISDEVLDERQSELAIINAERGESLANVAEARLDISRCEISCPFKAVVSSRIASVGEFVQIGEPIIRLLDIDNVEVSAQIQFGDVVGIEASDDLWFEHAAKRYPVKVRRVVGAVNTATRNQEMRLDFVADRALPGAGGQLFWRDRRPHVPGNLIVKRESKLGIFIVEGQKARFIALIDGASGRASPVEIPLTSAVIIEGFYNVSDGDLVSVK